MILLLVVACQESAADLYARFEKTYSEARSVSFRFRTEGAGSQKITMSGICRARPDDQISFELTTAIDGAEYATTLKSDGSRTRLTHRGEASVPRTIEGQSKLVVAALTRVSPLMILPSMIGHSRPKAVDPRIQIKLSDFAIAGKEKVGETEAVVLRYRARLDSLDCAVTLWLDAEKLRPLKRTTVLDKGATTLTDTYTEVSVEEIPETEFQTGK